MLGNTQKNSKWMAIAAVTGLIGTSAFAQQTNKTTATTEKSTYQKLRDRANLNYEALLYGPAIGNPLHNMQPDEASQNGGGQIAIRNIIGAAYVFDNGWNIGPVVDFDWVAVQEHGIKWRNPFVRLQMPNLLKFDTQAGEVTYTADARVFAPASAAAQGRNMLFGIGSKNVLNWNIGKSPFSMSLALYGQYNQYGQGTDGTFATSGTGDLAGTGNFVAYYGVLGVNYQPAPWVGIFAAYEMDGGLDRKTFNLTDQGIYVDIGASFNPIPEITITPFIDIKPKNPSFADGTSMHLDLSFSIL